MAVRETLDHHVLGDVQGLTLEVVVFPTVSGACRSLLLGVPIVWLVCLISGVL